MVQEKKPGTQRSTEIKRRNQHSKIRKNQWLKWLHVLSPLKWHLLCYFLSPIPDIPHFSVLVYVVSTDGTNKCEWHGRQATQLSQQRVYISMHEKDLDNHTKWGFFFKYLIHCEIVSSRYCIISLTIKGRGVVLRGNFVILCHLFCILQQIFNNQSGCLPCHATETALLKRHQSPSKPHFFLVCILLEPSIAQFPPKILLHFVRLHAPGSPPTAWIIPSVS